MASNRKARKKKPGTSAQNESKNTKAETNDAASSSPLASDKNAKPIQQKSSSSTTPKSLTIVGIGASAGGFEALESFLAHLPAESGMAFIVVVHLYPGKISMLPDLLGMKTTMSVQPVTHGVAVCPNCVYVIPTDHDLTILNGTLYLSDVHGKRADNYPINSFFRSLAQDQGRRAVGVVLSGTGTDGTLGIQAIKENLGLVGVQTVSSAKFAGMPSSAIATGLADFVLSPEEMAAPLIQFAKHSMDQVGVLPLGSEVDAKILQAIFVVLQSRTGHDFSQYKKNTIIRRIERRMSLQKIARIADYVKYLEASDHEPESLFRDLMIGVTSFFRDPQAFEFLQTHVFAAMLKDRPDGETIRVWVAGCSSGEEAYSLAIALHESIERAGCYFPVQIFATDIDDQAISFARCGVYDESIQIELGKKRFDRYFDDLEGRYRIKKMIREMLVFAPQNVIKDPPFTKLDLLSCRNLLIYLSSDLQKRLLPIFHYSLKPNGTLFLGSSESIGSSADLFSNVNKKWKIFARRASTTGLQSAVEFPLNGGISHRKAVPIATKKKDQMEELQLVEMILAESGASPCVVIDDECNLLYVHGRTGKFLEPPEGKASVNLLEMARHGVRSELKAAINRAVANKREVICRGLRVLDASGECFLDLTVRPILGPAKARPMMIVVFDETSSPTALKTIAPVVLENMGARSVADLQLELQQMKEHLQATIEELETSNEEHKSTNEELQSTNEELQSTNEELETSKEELQSLNEESSTVNSELQTRIEELTKSNDDIKNLLDSTSIATVFLDLQLNISRFTPIAKNVIPLTDTDIGRPIGNLSTTLVNADLTEMANSVLGDLMTRDQVLESNDGIVYLVQARPYRTIANRIDGVVITFEDITERKRAEDLLQESEYRFRAIFELANDAIVLIDSETLGFAESSQRAYEMLGYTQAEFSTMHISDIEAKKTTEEFKQHADRIVENAREVFNAKYRKKSGEEIDVRVRVQHTTVNGCDYLLSTWRDLSEEN